MDRGIRGAAQIGQDHPLLIIIFLSGETEYRLVLIELNDGLEELVISSEVRVVDDHSRQSRSGPLTCFRVFPRFDSKIWRLLKGLNESLKALAMSRWITVRWRLELAYKPRDFKGRSLISDNFGEENTLAVSPFSLHPPSAPVL